MNILMFAAMMVLLPILQNVDKEESNFAFYNQYIFLIIFCAIISTNISSRLIPLEGKCFWFTKLLPQSELKIIWGKFLLGASFSTASAWLAIIIVSIYFHHPLRITILAIIAAFIVSTSLSSVGLMIGVFFSRFDWDHPKRMLTTTGSLLITVSSLIITAVIGGIIALFYAIGIQLQFSEHFLDIQSVIIGLIISIVTILVVNHISARKLSQLEWEF